MKQGMLDHGENTRVNAWIWSPQLGGGEGGGCHLKRMVLDLGQLSMPNVF